MQKNANVKKVFVISLRKAKPSKFEQCWEAGLIANSKFSKKEMAQIKASSN